MLFGVETGLDSGDKALIVAGATFLGIVGDRVWSWVKEKRAQDAVLKAEAEKQRLEAERQRAEAEKQRAGLEEVDEAAEFDREMKREGVATRSLKQAYDRIAELHEEIKNLLLGHREEIAKYILQNHEFREQLQITNNRLAVCEANRQQQDARIAALEQKRPGGS
jgi:hypothetical protein